MSWNIFSNQPLYLDAESDKEKLYSTVQPQKGKKEKEKEGYRYLCIQIDLSMCNNICYIIYNYRSIDLVSRS